MMWKDERVYVARNTSSALGQTVLEPRSGGIQWPSACESV